MDNFPKKDDPVDKHLKETNKKITIKKIKNRKKKQRNKQKVKKVLKVP